MLRYFCKLMLVVLSVESPLFADEFVVFQDERSFSFSDKGFHNYYEHGKAPIPWERWPRDWTSPTDYWHGHWEIRIELLSTPEERDFTLQPCIWMHDADGESSFEDELESCGGPYIVMSTPGVYEVTTDPIYKWWHKRGGGNKVDLSRPHHFKRMGLVLRTPEYCYITPWNVTPNCWVERDHYLPFDFHITIVAVAEGCVFQGWDHYFSDGEKSGSEILLGTVSAEEAE